MLLSTEVKTATTLDLLAVLVGSKRTAATLLRNSGGSLFHLLHQEPGHQHGALCAQEGHSYTSRALVRLQAAKELTTRSVSEQLMRGDALTSPALVREYLTHRLAGYGHEVFMMLAVDASNRVIAIEEMFRGTLTQTSVYPREVLKAALRLNASALIFAHNHPSGTPEPSRADELLTQTLKQALSLVDVKVLDHFIVAGTKTLSFAERGLL
jgi:DNA repair protein RadC